MKRYYEHLPKKIGGKVRCQVLLDTGHRCREEAVMEVDAHLENELYCDGAHWIAFYVCQGHYDSQYLWKKSHEAYHYPSG